MSFPVQSLDSGQWFKLICGASFQDLPAIRGLCLIYALAGADCIDMAADPAVIAMAEGALARAQAIARAEPDTFPHWQGKPWLMVSLNDGADPHFRKASFDASCCPKDCDRPCERVCPAMAIDQHGVIGDRCYGCGRCLPVCPYGYIVAQDYVSTPRSAVALIGSGGVDAVEIHTQVGHFEGFERLWRSLRPVHHRLKLLAISCQDHPDVLDYLGAVWRAMQPLGCSLLWQTDGRPMSGDLGKGTIHASIRFAQKVLDADIPGYVQLAGGTNNHTAAKLKGLGLLHAGPATSGVAGVAYGGYARKILQPYLKRNQLDGAPALIEDDPQRLMAAYREARKLVLPLKGGDLVGRS